MEKKTALYDIHVEFGGRMVNFAGYLLPVQYQSGIIKEHKAVRSAAGLFDVSHMGEIFIKGKDALKNLNYLLTNDFTDLQAGRVRYSPMCNENGGVVDDLLVYKYSDHVYLAVVNAANKDKDYEHIIKHSFGDIEVTDMSDSFSQLSLQGPNAVHILEKLIPADELSQKYYSFNAYTRLKDIPCMISRTGYTGEDGFELYMDNQYAKEMWRTLIGAGEEFGILACGLGARDTLRMEASMPLYGHELNEDITPIEAGLGTFVKFEKKDFIGKAALALPAKRKLIGVCLLERGIAREGSVVYAGDQAVGTVTSGTQAPSLERAVAMAMVAADFNGELSVEVRGKKIPAKLCALPFYRRSK